MGKEIFQYFISFAYNDDDPPASAGKKPGDGGWISTFHEDLKQKFRELSALKPYEGFYPFFCKEGRDAGRISDTIRNEISKSHVLVAVVSPSYHKSTICRDEIDLFVRFRKEAGEDDERIARRLKVAVLRRGETYPDPEMHEVLKEVNTEETAEFCRQFKGGLYVTLCNPVPRLDHKDHAEYMDRIDWLAYAIKKQLDEQSKVSGLDKKKPGWLQSHNPFAKKIEKSVLVDGLPEDSGTIDEVRDALLSQGYESVFRPTRPANGSATATPAHNLRELMRASEIYLLVRRNAEARNALRRLGLAQKEAMLLRRRPANLFFANLRADNESIILDAHFPPDLDLSRPGLNAKGLAKALMEKVLASGAGDLP